MAFPVAARIFPQALRKKLKETAHDLYVKNNYKCISSVCKFIISIIIIIYLLPKGCSL